MNASGQKGRSVSARQKRLPSNAVAVADRWVEPILATGESLGLSRERLLKTADIPTTVSLGKDFDHHISLSQYFRLWKTGVEVSRRPDLPLLSATLLGAKRLTVIGFACMTCPTLGSAFDRLARYFHLLCSAARWKLEEHGADLCLAFDFMHEAAPTTTSTTVSTATGSDIATEAVILEIAYLARMMSSEFIPIEKVRFRHRCAGQEALYQSFLKAPVRWGSLQNGIVLRRSTFDIPFLKTDPNMLAFFESQLEELTRTHGSERPVADRVRALLAPHMMEGGAPLAAIAKQLAMSERSLRRHLHAEGTSFLNLRDQVRIDLAKQLLATGGMTVTEIAFLVGFADVSPFQRFFRRVVGKCPTAYRDDAHATKYL